MSDTADRDQKTEAILFISLALGGQLASNIGIDFSEMWSIYQTEQGVRRIAVRPARRRKPMKTRMFQQSGEPEFDWKFNPEDWENAANDKWRMDTWFDMWSKNNFEKLPLPGTTAFDNLYKKLKS